MQMYEFPIASLFDNFKNKCLVDAMSCTSLPLLQVGLNSNSRYRLSTVVLIAEPRDEQFNVNWFNKKKLEF